MTSRSFGPLIKLSNHFNKEDYLEILNGYVLPFVEEEFGSEYFYYYQDNSPIHKAHVVMDWFQSNFTPDQLLPVPARSPDFNPIEHAWAQAKVNVRQSGNYQ